MGERVVRRWLVLAVLCASLVLVVVNNTIVNVALPTISRELSASTTDLQWIVDSYALVFSALLLAFGHAGDRFGRRRALLLGLAVFAATSTLASQAEGSGQLVAAAAAMGVGAALVFPATLAILVDVFRDPKERAWAIGIWSACTGLAVAIGPVSGGLLLEWFWWGSVYLVSAPVALLTMAAAWLVVPESKDPAAGRLDRLGLLLSVSGVGALVWAIIEGPRLGWTSAAVLSGAAAAVLLLTTFVVWERRQSHPLLDVSLFRSMRFTAASLAVTTAFFALFGFIFLITQFLQLVQGYSALEAGVRTLPFAAATALASPVAIALVHRVGSKLVVTGGLLVMAAGFGLASRLQVDTPYIGLTVLSMVVIAVGLGLTTAPATESIMGAVPRDKAGVGSAVNDTTRELGGTLGVAVVGSVFAAAYTDDLGRALAGLGLPAAAVEAAQESLAAALAVVAQLPPGVGDAVGAAAREAFVRGLHRGSLIAAGATVLGAVLAAAFLPARVAPVAAPPVPDDVNDHHPAIAAAASGRVRETDRA